MDKEIIEPEVVEVNKISKKAIANIHNALIQARHRLSSDEIRLMDTIISFIQPDDEDFKRYKIPVSIFKEFYGTHRKDIYNVVKRAVEGLLSKPIKIETETEKGKRKFKMFNFISYGEYEEGAGSFYVEIDRNFKPYLLGFKEFFSKIPIKYTYVLKSKYSIRLYELLKQYENTGYRVDYLPDLREMLGIEPNEYKRFEAFERIVLKRAVEEINEKTDLEVSYRKKKTGRRITHIEFEISSKQGEDTQTEKSISESIDIQRKIADKDLWEDVLYLLDVEYNISEEDLRFLKEYAIVQYKTDRRPKEMIIDTIIHPNWVGDRKQFLKILTKHFEKIKYIVKIQTNHNYTAKVSKELVESVKDA